MKFLHKVMWHYLPRVQPLGRWIPFCLILVVVNAALQSSLSRICGWLLDRLMADPSGFMKHLLIPVCLGSVLATLGYAALEYTQKIFTAMVGIKAKATYRQDLYTHLLALDESFYLRSRAGDISSRLTKDIEEGFAPVFWHLTQVVWSTLMILFSIGILFTLHWVIGLAYLVFLPFWWIYMKYVVRRVRLLDKEVREKFADLNARATEDITNQSLIRVFAKEKDRALAFRETAENYQRRTISLSWVSSATYSSLRIALNFTLPMVILVGCVTILRGKLSAGEVLAAYGSWVASMVPIDMISRNLAQLISCTNGMERVFEFFEATPEVSNVQNACPLQISAGTIRLENIHFGYPSVDRPPVLHDIDLVIPGGSRCALVGSSGSGKSTLAHLLMRFYDPIGGRVLVDGQDLRHITQHSLRRQVGLVQQDSLLWAGTIRDNLLFVKPEADEIALWEALEKAELASFTRQTADGLDTMLGERGVRLSGGQRQRLALSRLFLLSPPIIILDEATSALDGPAERAVQRSIDRLTVTRCTMVVIAHRLSTIVDCEKIVVLDKGTIVAQGSHLELLESCPHYRDLCAKQGLIKLSPI